MSRDPMNDRIEMVTRQDMLDIVDMHDDERWVSIPRDEAESLAIALIQATPGKLPGVVADEDEVDCHGEYYSRDYAVRLGLALIRAAAKEAK